MFIWEGLVPRWRSRLWNGLSFLGMPMALPLNLYGFKLMMFFAPFNSSLTMFVLRPNGVYEQMRWDENQVEWNSRNECETYNKCGDYASCNDKGAIICSCFQEFGPKVNGNWSNGDWSDGCVRNTPLHCNEIADGFVRVDGVKLPDSSIWIGNIDKEGCERNCLRNYSFEAYSYVNGIGLFGFGRSLDGYTAEVEGSIFALLAIHQPSGMLSYRGKLPDFSLFNLQTLATAANDFHLSNKLGQGGVGHVYKYVLILDKTMQGKLPSSHEIAVKALSKSSRQG
ncbi:hypothetical protein IEQ34_016934 [Dendrobium chrysotoxum]|uniref:Uncharacterized protein n=1 Tax=Dendrobium chrysotoxum TaxID=161865 RepID=A0AAV7FZ12_DENCH|nr:hypothetical protein IEQ34_016934 [Dendrobium chrysotoxum]